MNKELELIYQQIIAPWIGAMTPTVAPLFFEGLIAGSEFLTYNVNKLYICSSLVMTAPANSSATAGQGTTTLYDAGNVAADSYNYQNFIYDGTAANTYYMHNTQDIQNVYFSRLVNGARITGMKFIGYRITRV